MDLKVKFSVLLHSMSGDLSLCSNPEEMGFIPPRVLKSRKLVRDATPGCRGRTATLFVSHSKEMIRLREP